MLAGLLAPTASAAIAHVPLEPGDSVHATDGPTDRDLEIVSLFGRSVVVIHTAEPAVVGVQVRHSDDSLTTHVLQTEGTDLAPQLVAIDAQIQAQAQSIAASQAAIANLTARLELIAQAAATQQAETKTLQEDLHNATAMLQALRDSAAAIQASTNEANQAIGNLRMPDLAPIEERLDGYESQAQDQSRAVTRLTVLAVFTLTGVLGALLHTAWPYMRSRLNLRQDGDAPGDQEDDLEALLQEQRERSESLAAELVPGSAGAAGHLHSELRDKLTPETPSEEE